MFWNSRPQKFSDVKRKLVLPLEEAKKRATILVIDDDASAFPVTRLRAEGYNIQHWEKLDTVRAIEDGQFDIIILDIHGICAEGISENDGLGVLEHLKKVNPAQIVIAFSGKKFDLKQEKFWRIADDYLGKPIDVLTAKARIDSLLKERFTIERYWQNLAGYLRAHGVTDEVLSKLESKLADAAENKSKVSESDIKSLLSGAKDIISTAWIIVQVILKLAE